MSLIDGRMQDAFLHTATSRYKRMETLLWVVSWSQSLYVPSGRLTSPFDEVNFVGRRSYIRRLMKLYS